jgi:hypothetical protein
MRKSILILFLLPFLVQAQDVIPWDGPTQLKWRDFKGRVDSRSKADAMTAAQINSEGTKSSTDGKKMLFVIAAEFIPRKSWVRKNAKKEELLNHERLHFDICELYCRKLREQISKTKWTRKSFNKSFKKLYKRNWKTYTKRQKEYDSQTRHGILSVEQLRWQKMIAKELKSLERFESLELVMPLN